MIVEKVKLYHVDSFTDRPFAGNPAGVCVLEKPADERWMQCMAAELNVSETAFVVPREDGFDLRWFSPKVEVDLCGHGTLATAHVLYETGVLRKDQEAVFHTRSGVLVARYVDGGAEISFPAARVTEITQPEGFAEALGLDPVCVCDGGLYMLAEVDSEQTVRDAKPDFEAVAAFPTGGITITAKASTPGYDFVSRFFAPSLGVDEDPVTGSAHCLLGPYWQARLRKDEFTAYQASARGGSLKVRVAGDRVYIAGQAVTVYSGEVR